MSEWCNTKKTNMTMFQIKTSTGEIKVVDDYYHHMDKLYVSCFGTVRIVYMIGVNCEWYFPEHEAEIERLKNALHFDQTGLAKGLVDLTKLCEGYQWIREGRGPYAWNDDRYKEEVTNILDKVEGIAKHTLQISGAVAHSICCDRELLNVTIEDIGYVKKGLYEERIAKIKAIIEEIKKLEPPDDLVDYTTLESYELTITTVTELLNKIPEL